MPSLVRLAPIDSAEAAVWRLAREVAGLMRGLQWVLIDGLMVRLIEAELARLLALVADPIGMREGLTRKERRYLRNGVTVPVGPEGALMNYDSELGQWTLVASWAARIKAAACVLPSPAPSAPARSAVRRPPRPCAGSRHP